jgi:3-hydroxyisobutyrate dehydrogenase-like beta-hydroxyacid dehydrogenase
MTITVGFIGLGRLGSALARCLVEAGFAVVAFDIDPAAITAVPGLQSAPSPRQVAEAADVICVAVMSEQQVLEMATGPNGLLAGVRPGTPVLVHSTISHDALRRLVAMASAVEVPVLDAPVSGEQGHRSVPNLCVMVGGDADAFARAQPVLHTFASLTVHLGPSGAGMDAKLSLNLLRYLGYLASQEAKHLARSTGIAEARFSALVEHSGAFRYTGTYESVFEEDLERREGNAATALKDLRAALSRAAEVGIPLPATEQSLALVPTLWDLPAGDY